MPLRLSNLTTELVGLSPITPVVAQIHTGDLVDVSYEIVGLGTPEVAIVIHIPAPTGEQLEMAKTPPETTGAAGPDFDPATGISAPEDIPLDQGSYQDANEPASETPEQDAANLTGNTIDGVEPTNTAGAGGNVTQEATQTAEGASVPDAPEPAPEAPSESADAPPAEDFSDLDDPAA